VADAALLFEVISAPGGAFPLSENAGTAQGIKSLKVVCRGNISLIISSGGAANVLDATEVFKELGASVREVQLKGMEETPALPRTLQPRSASHHDVWLKRHPGITERTCGPPGSRQKHDGLDLYSGYAEEGSLQRRMEQALDLVDLLLTPTLPSSLPTSIKQR